MNNDSLYYKSPAKNWLEALPLGNGSLGAMLFSGKKKGSGKKKPNSDKRHI